jgi:hypothetical protein
MTAGHAIIMRRRLLDHPLSRMMTTQSAAQDWIDE